MKKFCKIFFLSTLFWCLLLTVAISCTTFCLDHGGRLVFGRNFDWNVGDGLVIINKRDVAKTSILVALKQTNKALTWTSRFGSVTFNQSGCEFPLGGMNEAGLVVESMMLDDTYYPRSDSRYAIWSLQWIQYQLDNFSTIEEILASDSQIRIRGLGVPGLHFLVCDRRGKIATIEFIQGKLVAHTSETMPVKVLSNNTYADCLKFWKEGEIPKPDRNQSVERFIRAANMVENYDPIKKKRLVDYAFNILNKVEHDSYLTQWSIVYDITDRCVYFRTHENHKIRYLKLKSLDFSCATPVKILDIKADLSGNVAMNFIDYTYQTNRELFGKAFGDNLFHMSGDVLETFSKYPETTSCME